MSRPTIEAGADRPEQDRVRLLCPGPGIVRFQRKPGERLVPDSRIGLLLRSERVYELRVPANVQGVVTEVFISDPWVACEHNQPFATLSTVAISAEDQLATPARSSDAATGLFEVRSPTHGTFYRRPSPDAPLYIEVGQQVARGQTLALVEVMKCFSPITFEPPAGHENGTVREILVEDGKETLTDQPLIRLALGSDGSASSASSN